MMLYYRNKRIGKLVAKSHGTTAITAKYVWGPDRALVKKEVDGVMNTIAYMINMEM